MCIWVGREGEEEGGKGGGMVKEGVKKEGGDGFTAGL